MRRYVEVALVLLIVAALGVGVLASRGVFRASGGHGVLVGRATATATPVELAGAPPATPTAAATGIVSASVTATATATAIATATPPPSAASASTSSTAGGAAFVNATANGYVTTNPAANPHGLAPVDAPSPVVSHLRIPVAGVNAQVDTGYVARGTNAMLAPRGPWVVDWYPYSAVPGTGGNAVFAGHVDYVHIGAAVFWYLRKLVPGDHIEVTLASGKVLTYQVLYNRTYAANAGPWAQLFSPTAGKDVLTIYTCDGTFHAGAYNDRRVIRAVRVSPRSDPPPRTAG